MRRHALLITFSMAASLWLAAPATAANATAQATTPNVAATAAPAAGARRVCARDARPLDVRHARCTGRTGRWW